MPSEQSRFCPLCGAEVQGRTDTSFDLSNLERESRTPNIDDSIASALCGLSEALARLACIFDVACFRET